MNKKAIIGIIIAVAIIIVIISMITYGNMSNPTISSGNTTTTSNPPSEPVKPAGRHLSVELNESVGMATKP